MCGVVAHIVLNHGATILILLSIDRPRFFKGRALVITRASSHFALVAIWTISKSLHGAALIFWFSLLKLKFRFVFLCHQKHVRLNRFQERRLALVALLVVLKLIEPLRRLEGLNEWLQLLQQNKAKGHKRLFFYVFYVGARFTTTIKL